MSERLEEWRPCGLADKAVDGNWRGCWLFGPKPEDTTKPGAQMHRRDCSVCCGPALVEAVEAAGEDAKEPVGGICALMPGTRAKIIAALAMVPKKEVLEGEE